MKKLRIGTFLAPSVMPMYQVIADEIGRALNIKTELVVETDYESCKNDLNDVCFICSLPYVIFEKQGLDISEPIVAPVLIGKRYNDRPIYFSDVIVKSDSNFKSFLDLRGASWCYNEPLSQSGYGITRYHLAKLGETKGFFSKVVQAGYHEESIRKVANGEIDGSAIDSQDLAIAMKQNPTLKKSLRIVDSIGPSTIQPMSVSKRLPEELKLQIQNIVLNLHKDPVVQEVFNYCEVSHFTKVDAKSYDDIREMYEFCEKANFIKII